MQYVIWCRAAGHPWTKWGQSKTRQIAEERLAKLMKEFPDRIYEIQEEPLASTVTDEQQIKN